MKSNEAVEKPLNFEFSRQKILYFQGVNFLKREFFYSLNTQAHRERPDRDFSGLAKPQRGRDAVARRVSRLNRYDLHSSLTCAA
jgi:hypothetical protein